MRQEIGRIGILSGGPSSERDISIRSGEAVYRALLSLGLDVVCIDPKDASSVSKDIVDLGVEVAFIALHGKFGEDGTIQTILDEIGIPYTGSDYFASHLAFDKSASREIFKKKNIPVPRYKLLQKREEMKSILDSFSLPFVVKPCCEGSSIGLSIVENEKDIDNAVSQAFSYDSKVLIEEYIRGEDITVGIFEDKPLPVVHIKPKDKFYSFNAKYTTGMSDYVVPAEFPQEILKEAQRLSLLAHESLGCSFFSRADMMLDLKEKKIVMLEVNTIPGLTSTSLLPKAAQASGINFTQLCLRMVELAFDRKMYAHNRRVI